MTTTRLGLANNLLDLGRYDDALRIVLAALAETPTSPLALCTLARHHEFVGDYPAMLDAADRAVAAAPESSWAHRVRAAALRRLGQATAAVEAADRAVALAPAEASAHDSRSRAALAAREWRSAYASALRAVDLAPTESGYHVTLADVRAETGDLRAARRGYLEALRLDPDDRYALRGLAGLDLRRRPVLAARRFAALSARYPAEHAYRSGLKVAVTRLVLRLATVGAALIVTASLLLAGGVPDGPRAIAVGGLVAGYLATVWLLPRRLPTGAGAVRWLALIAVGVAEFAVPAAVLPEAVAGATLLVAVLALGFLMLVHVSHATDRVGLALRRLRVARPTPGRRRLD